MNRKMLKGVVLNFIAGLIFGAFPIFANLYTNFGGAILSFNFYGFLIAAVLLGLIVLITRKRIIPGKKMFLYLLLAGFINVVTRILLTESYAYLNAGVSTTLHFMYPILVAIISYILFKDAMPGYKWIIFVIASLSVSLFITGEGGASSVKGIVLALISGFCFASYLVVMEKTKLINEDPVVVFFWISLISAGGCMLASIGGESLFVPVPAKAWMMVLLCAFFNNIVAFFSQMLGMRYVNAATAAILGLFEPTFSCIFGAIFLNEYLTGKSILGILLILGSLVVMIILDNKRTLKSTT